MDFAKIFEHQQRALELELALARERFAHYGLRGNAVEIAMRDFLEKHLSRNFTPGTGEVIATEGDTSLLTSGQIDVVISNSMQPFIGARDIPTTFLIEAVQSAGEVKSVLSRGMVKEELTKGAKFKALRAKNVSGLIGVPRPDVWESYYVFYRPYFLFTFTSTVNWKTLLLEIMLYIREHRRMPFDGVFLMDKNIVILLSPYLKFPMSPNTGIPFKHDFENERGVTGGIHIYSHVSILALFMAWLVAFKSDPYGNNAPINFYLQKILDKPMPDISLGTIPNELSSKQGSMEPIDFLIEVLLFQLSQQKRKPRPT